MMTSALDLFGEHVDAVFDFVGDVRNHLHGLAEIFAVALLVEHGLINLAAGEIVQARELDVGEPLVMAEVEVGFRAVVEHINFAVLIRVHRAGIHVEIGVELLQRDLEAAVFEQRAERRRRQAFAQRTHHTAGYKNVFHIVKRSSVQNLFPPRCHVRRHIHAHAVVIHLHDRDRNAVFQRPQLLQLLRLFQRRHRKFHQPQQRFAPVTINAQMLQKRKRRQLFGHRTTGGIAQIRNRAPGKI